jgi:hypothetical protein
MTLTGRLRAASSSARRALRVGAVPGVRTAKLTLAAVTAYLLAGALNTSPDRILAPLTALLVVQLTLYQTVAHAFGRVISVLSGVLLAVAVAHTVGLTWWSLGAVVLASLVVGYALRLGEHVLEVPISAMIVLAVGGATETATGRVVETLLGGAVGLAANLLAPPLHVRGAEDGVDRLANALAEALRDLAADVRRGWSTGDADHWMSRARDLRRAVDRADRDLARAEESARMNPRGGRARGAQPRLRVALTALEHCHVAFRNLCRALLDRSYSIRDGAHEPYAEDVRAALAEALDRAAHTVRSAGAYAASSSAPDSTLSAVEAGLRELSEARERLATLLLVDPVADQGAWQAHGALLAGVDRLRVEAEAAVRPQDGPWRPPPVAQRQREMVWRMVSSDGRRRRRP